MAKYYEGLKIIEAIDELYNSPWAQGLEGEGVLMNYYHDGIKDALEIFKNILRGECPDDLKIETAEVTPVKPGTWQKGKDYYWHCSECGSRHTRTDVLHCKYCPDCGARLNAKGDA